MPSPRAARKAHLAALMLACVSNAPCWLQARLLRRPLLHPQVCAPFINTQPPGEPVPKLDSYSRGGNRFMGNHYIKVVVRNLFSSVLSQS